MARSKKEIDRELMYKKILPTSMSTEATADKLKENEDTTESQMQNSDVASLEVNIPEPIKIIVSSDEDRNHEQKEELIAIDEDQITQPKELSLTEPEIAPNVNVLEKSSVKSVTFVDSEPSLNNLMEGFVEKRLDAALAKFKCCTCEKCRKDVLAIALNKLPPLYVIDDDPDLRDLHERERAAQVATALVQAILIVKSRPAH